MGKKFFVAVSVLCFLSVQVFSQELSKEALKARDFVKKAIEFWKKNGKDVALKEFSNTKGQFVDGEFYLFVHDYSKANEQQCINIARGDGNTAMIGKNLWTIKDPDGVFLYQELIKIAKSKEGFGWVDYKRTNPETKKIESKSSYIQKAPKEDILIGCGFYK